MSKAQISPLFYLSFIKFVLHAKHEIIAACEDIDLSPMQAFTLLLSDKQNPHSMNFFCKTFSCDASNVTGIVDGLEQKGLAHRAEDPHDRRVKVIQLTAKGEKLQQELAHKIAASTQFLFDPLSADEAGTFRANIEKIADSLSSPK